MNLLGYIRVSRVGGRSGEDFIAPRVQRERIESWAKTYGHTVEFMPDELDQSGGKLQRPVFTAALERCERGEADGIIVAKLDRFARSVPDAATAIRRLEEAGAVLVSVADQLDTSTPMGRFARTMMLAVAELELDRIRESWATAQQYAVKRGVHIASRPPTGYKRGKDGRLELVPRSAEAVAEVFQRRAAGASLSELAQLLEAAPRRRPVPQQALDGDRDLEAAQEPRVHRAGQERRSQPRRCAPRDRDRRGVASRPRSAWRRLAASLAGWRAARGPAALRRVSLRDETRLDPRPRRVEDPPVPLPRRPRRRPLPGRRQRPRARDRAVSHRVGVLRALGPTGSSPMPDLMTGQQQAQYDVEAAQVELAEWLEVVSISNVGRAAYVTGIEARQRRLDEASRPSAPPPRRAAPPHSRRSRASGNVADAPHR